METITINNRIQMLLASIPSLSVNFDARRYFKSLAVPIRSEVNRMIFQV
jgi:hypothetical protein